MKLINLHIAGVVFSYLTVVLMGNVLDKTEFGKVVVYQNLLNMSCILSTGYAWLVLKENKYKKINTPNLILISIVNIPLLVLLITFNEVEPTHKYLLMIASIFLNITLMLNSSIRISNFLYISKALDNVIRPFSLSIMIIITILYKNAINQHYILYMIGVSCILLFIISVGFIILNNFTWSDEYDLNFRDFIAAILFVVANILPISSIYLYLSYINELELIADLRFFELLLLLPLSVNMALNWRVAVLQRKCNDEIIAKVKTRLRIAAAGCTFVMLLIVYQIQSSWIFRLLGLYDNLVLNLEFIFLIPLLNLIAFVENDIVYKGRTRVYFILVCVVVSLGLLVATLGNDLRIFSFILISFYAFPKLILMFFGMAK